mmetsp:Transcript_49206/g.130296  ORF Transcript_49206/g.130296 Transcript_49206/m.130296 type:complete len:225 (-) Transcript_49206:822-1496(-)
MEVRLERPSTRDPCETLPELPGIKPRLDKSSNCCLRLLTSSINDSTVPENSSFMTAAHRMCFARAANFSVERVSPKHRAEGLTLATITVFELPPSESRNKKVSLLSRYLTNGRRCPTPGALFRRWPLRDRDMITFVKALRLRLMAPASFTRRLSWRPGFWGSKLCRSEPARSTRFSLAERVAVTPPAAVLVASRTSVKTACERELRSFICVAPTCLWWRPFHTT